MKTITTLLLLLTLTVGYSQENPKHDAVQINLAGEELQKASHLRQLGWVSLLFGTALVYAGTPDKPILVYAGIGLSLLSIPFNIAANFKIGKAGDRLKEFKFD